MLCLCVFKCTQQQQQQQPPSAATTLTYFSVLLYRSFGLHVDSSVLSRSSVGPILLLFACLLGMGNRSEPSRLQRSQVKMGRKALGWKQMGKVDPTKPIALTPLRHIYKLYVKREMTSTDVRDATHPANGRVCNPSVKHQGWPRRAAVGLDVKQWTGFGSIRHGLRWLIDYCS